jgi:O-6-methylguanine DNA methyltransferase
MDNFYTADEEIRGIGRIRAAATKDGVCAISVRGGERRLLAMLPEGAEISAGPNGHLDRLFGHLRAFARGEGISPKTEFHLVCGTPFERRVWTEIKNIPFGETRSYAELAKRIGRPKAFRAVANACGKNPLPIIIPCHRVIASDGGIGGFTGGLALKRRLLALENILL